MPTAAADQCVARTAASRQSVFEILSAGSAAGITREEAEHEDADKEEDDRVNGELEGEHGETVQLLVHR